MQLRKPEKRQRPKSRKRLKNEGEGEVGVYPMTLGQGKSREY